MVKQDTVTVSKEEYASLKRKAAIADDILLQLEASLRDIQNGRIKKAEH